MPFTSTGIAFERAGRSDPGRVPVLLLHAGVADRCMWDPQWDGLTARHEVIRCDLRGLGESTQTPAGALSYHGDVIDLLGELGIGRVHLIGASFGAGVAVEVALIRPSLVASLLLVAPGGSLIAAATEELRTFGAAERDALERGDLDAAVDANLRWWVDGPRRAPGTVGPDIRRRVGPMQRLAFEITEDWDDLDEVELEPPPHERLAEVQAPALVLVGTLDIDAIVETGTMVAGDMPDARLVLWDEAAHMVTLERPDDFLDLAIDWLAARP